MIRYVINDIELFDDSGLLESQEWVSSDGRYSIVVGRHFSGVAVLVLEKFDSGWTEIGFARIEDPGVTQEELFDRGFEVGKRMLKRQDFSLKETTFSSAIAQTPSRIPHWSGDDPSWLRKRKKKMKLSKVKEL